MIKLLLSVKKTRSLLQTSVLAALVLTVAACGGGGSALLPTDQPQNPVPVQPPTTPPTSQTLTLQSLQGRWTTTSNEWVARWLPPAAGQNSAALWILSQDGQFLSVLNATVNGSSTVIAKGTRYNLDPLSGRGGSTTTLDWQGTANLSASPATLSFRDGQSFALQDPLKNAALQLNAVGAWTSNVGLTTLNWQVDELGVITGNSQTGCMYVGVLNARTDVDAYEVKLSETCAGVVLQFTGIGVISSMPRLNQLTLALVSANSQAGKVLYLQRQ